MNATLYYPCTVRVPTHGTKAHAKYTDEIEKSTGDNLVRPRYLPVNFHNVAVYFLQQVITLETDENALDAVLSTTTNSLRSILVMAMGIRGIVRAAMGASAHEWENAASYCVTKKKKLEPSNLAISSILMGSYEASGAGEDDGVKPTTRQRDAIRDAKITMHIDAWLKGKNNAAISAKKPSLTAQEYMDLPLDLELDKGWRDTWRRGIDHLKTSTSRTSASIRRNTPPIAKYDADAFNEASDNEDEDDEDDEEA